MSTSFKSMAIACMFCAVALVVASSGAGQAAAAAAPEAKADMAAAGDRDTKVERDVAAAEAKIRGNKAEMEAFMKAVQSNNSDLVKGMLAKNGVPQKELDRARLVLKDRAGGMAARDVIIVGFCCPLIIIIIVYA